MTAKAKKTPLPPGLFGLILAASQSRLDPSKLRSIVGAVTVRTLDQVAAAFDVSPNTVKQSWRSAGMPGSPGRWPLLAILEWRIEHEAKNAKRFSGTADDRQAEADARKTELQVEKLELEMAETAGRLIDREVAGTAFRSILSELAEASATIGEEMETEFPIEIAQEKVETIKRMFNRILTAAAEKGSRVIPPRDAK